MTLRSHLRQRPAVAGAILALVAASAANAQFAVVVGPRPISADFFDRSYARTEGRQHLGIDIVAPPNAKVYAPITGEVIVNNTGHRDIMEAYMVIRSIDGVEHVLGHISSSIGKGKRVRKGVEIGKVRDWGRRSHVHWGKNRYGVRQAMTGGWGWGRAPLSATKQDAAVRGWFRP